MSYTWAGRIIIKEEVPNLFWEIHMNMNEVKKCVFIGDALMNANDEEKVIALATDCCCSGECTLENGCVLYKRKDELTGEEDFFTGLRSEILSHMLGE